MKNLTALVFAGFVLIAPAFGYETDKFKYIPKGANVYMFDIDKNGTADFYWYDKKPDGIMQPEEIFIDLNQDGIPDISYKRLIEIYEQYEKFRKESNIMQVSL